MAKKSKLAWQTKELLNELINRKNITLSTNECESIDDRYLRSIVKRFNSSHREHELIITEITGGKRYEFHLLRSREKIWL